MKNLNASKTDKLISIDPIRRGKFVKTFSVVAFFIHGFKGPTECYTDMCTTTVQTVLLFWLCISDLVCVLYADADAQGKLLERDALGSGFQKKK